LKHKFIRFNNSLWFARKRNNKKGLPRLDAITAAIVGGTSLSGGVGTIGGTLAGAIIIGIINTGMNTLGISPYYQLVIKGSVILAAVIIDRNIAEKGNRREG